jgi:hypothetical protein
MYRGYFLGIALLMFGGILAPSYPLIGIPIFVFGTAYILIKEIRRIRRG